jgi:hypothetical protein
LWGGTERLTVNVKYACQDRQSNGSGFDQGDPPWTQHRCMPESTADEWSLLNLDVLYRFDWGRLISTTSWFDQSTRSETDLPYDCEEAAREYGKGHLRRDPPQSKRISPIPRERPPTTGGVTGACCGRALAPDMGCQVAHSAAQAHLFLADGDTI